MSVNRSRAQQDSQSAKEFVPGNLLHDIPVEEALLGSLLWNAEHFHEVRDVINPEAFYEPRNRNIFESMISISNEGKGIDAITVGSHLADINRLEMIGGQEYLNKLLEQSPTTIKLESYASIIQGKYIRRTLQKVGGDIAEMGMTSVKPVEEIVDDAEKTLFEVTNRHTHARYKDISGIVPGLVDEIVKASESSDVHRGIPTGYNKIDNALSGFHKSDLIILAARPSVGKTSLALDIARKTALNHGTSVGMFSLEMSNSQLIERLLATEAHLDAWKVRTGRLRAEQHFSALNEAADRLRSLPIYIDDRSGLSTLNIRSTARRMKREHNIQLLVVDYLQLISPHDTRKSDSLVQHITEVSRTLKTIARELEIPVLAISQLSRDIEKRKGKPRLSDLRDSGSIEQDADVVMFLHRNTEESYEGDDTSPVPIDLLIEKHRNGPTGRVKLLFDKKYVTFVEPAQEEYQEIEQF